MKGNKIINFVDPAPVQQIRLINGMLIQRQILFLIIDGSRSMTGDFNMNRKSTINVKKAQPQEKTLMLLILVLFMGRSLTTMQTSKLIMRNMSMID